MTDAQRDNVVLGGGLAGAAVACLLALDGRDVLLLERTSGPHDKVCGEFLSPEGIAYLHRLGVDPSDFGAVPIDRVRLSMAGRTIERRLPFAGLSLSRRSLDEAVLKRAAAAGAEIRRGVRVMTLEGQAGDWRVRLQNGAVLAASTVFLATGKHDLRTHRRPRGIHSDLIGVKQRVRLAHQQAGDIDRTVELFGFDDGYGGLEPLEDGSANLCIVVRRRRVKADRVITDDLLAAMRRGVPTLARRLSGAVALTDRPCTVSTIPYGHVALRSGGVWRLGDQAAVIPSFAGDGMAIALHSAVLAADMLNRGKTAWEFQRRLARDVAFRVVLASLSSPLAVRPWTQYLMARALAAFPQLTDVAARSTRIRKIAVSGALASLNSVTISENKAHLAG